MVYCVALYFFHLIVVNFPITFLSVSRDIKCGRFPDENNLVYDNAIWQTLKTVRGSVKLLNAYLDTRENNAAIRVNGNAESLDITIDTIHCQFWDETSKIMYVVKATAFIPMPEEFWKLKSKDNRPYLITCPLDSDQRNVPSSVSLTLLPCDDAKNNMKVIDNQPVNGVKKEFGVCTEVKSCNNLNCAKRFVEWVHMLRILGVDKIYFHNKNPSPSLAKILRHFELIGFIEIWPYFHPSISDSTNQIEMLQINTLNDCFHRIRNLYEYVVILFPFDMIVPMMEADKTWHAMLFVNLEMSIKRDSYRAKLAKFPTIGTNLNGDIPEYHAMLQHTMKSRKTEKSAMSILLPERVLVVSNRNAFLCLGSSCDSYVMPQNVSQTNRYGGHVRDRALKPLVEDRTMWKFKEVLIDSVAKTLDGLTNDES